MSQEARKRAALHALVADCRDLRDLERLLRPFNIFDVLKSADNEIRHSNVLAWLFDPDGTHGLDDLFLRRWLMLVFYGIESPGSYLDPVEIDSVPFRSVRIRREWNRIDVLVEIETATHGRWVICIENKVWATQSDDQLKTYKQVVDHVFPDHVKVYIYLTVTAEPPDDPSYVVGTYMQVRSALEACLEEHKGSIGDGPRMLIEHYVSVLKERFMENDEISRLAKQIWKSHKDALEIILDNRPDNFRSFADEVKNLFTTAGFRVLKTTAHGRVHFLPSCRWDPWPERQRD